MTAETISIFYPTTPVLDGTPTVGKATLPREQVIGRLDGTKAADQLRADPDLRVVMLLDPAAIKAWMMPDEYRALVEALPDPEEDE